jgi:hypothetical protein
METQEICYSHNGYYPYPIFALLTTYQRIGLFALSGATMWVAGGALRALYAYVNGYELTEALEKKSNWRSGQTCEVQYNAEEDLFDHV